MPASCIIPFYNESARLGAIVDVVLSCDEIEEVILVDDGSDDGGWLRPSHRLTLHRFPHNKGKAEAMRFGFQVASFDTVVFIDADLKGLTRLHIRQLLRPVLSGTSDMTVSMREHLSFFDVVSGERALRKSTWHAFFSDAVCHRNAMEIFMNYYALSNSLHITWIPWSDVSQTYKSQKFSWFDGVAKDVRNVVDWIRQVGTFRFGCTYLLSWLLIIAGGSWLTRVYRSVFVRMYGKRLTTNQVQ